MTKKKIMIVGNWKMHLNVSQSSTLVANIQKNIKPTNDIEIVLAPSMLALQPISQQINHRQFSLCAQNAFYRDEGGYTGEVSVAMLRGIADYLIIGHSERRIYFGETDNDVRDKVASAIRNNIKPIICVGETANERHNGHAKQVLHDQLITALANVTSEEFNQVTIAYEPVWAISSFGGQRADIGLVKEVFKYIRLQISELYGDKSADNMRLLYGGSIDEHSARSFLELNDCDGCLVGSASLNYHKFSTIVNEAYKLNREK